MANNNGYRPSIIATEDGVCMLCGLCTSTARHEIFYGTGERALSKKYGLWVNLCPRCHARVHADKQGEANKALQKIAISAWLRHGGTLSDFKRLFHNGNVKHWEEL